jgi:hypothetical protein
MRVRAMSSVALGMVRVRPIGEYTCQHAGIAAVKTPETDGLAGSEASEVTRRAATTAASAGGSHRLSVVILAVPPLVEELGVGLQAARLHLREVPKRVSAP